MRHIGHRMRQCCEILHRMGGKANAQSHVYMQLDYNGGSSNMYGHAALQRAMARGLIEIDGKYKVGHPVPVRLTDAGRQVATGEGNGNAQG